MQKPQRPATVAVSRYLRRSCGVLHSRGRGPPGHENGTLRRTPTREHAHRFVLCMIFLALSPRCKGVIPIKAQGAVRNWVCRGVQEFSGRAGVCAFVRRLSGAHGHAPAEVGRVCLQTFTTLILGYPPMAGCLSTATNRSTHWWAPQRRKESPSAGLQGVLGRDITAAISGGRYRPPFVTTNATICATERSDAQQPT